MGAQRGGEGLLGPADRRCACGLLVGEAGRARQAALGRRGEGVQVGEQTQRRHLQRQGGALDAQGAFALLQFGDDQGDGGEQRQAEDQGGGDQLVAIGEAADQGDDGFEQVFHGGMRNRAGPAARRQGWRRRSTNRALPGIFLASFLALPTAPATSRWLW